MDGEAAGGGVGVNRGGTIDSVGENLATPSQTCGGPTKLKGAEHAFSVPSCKRDDDKAQPNALAGSLSLLYHSPH